MTRRFCLSVTSATRNPVKTGERVKLSTSKTSHASAQLVSMVTSVSRRSTRVSASRVCMVSVKSWIMACSGETRYLQLWLIPQTIDIHFNFGKFRRYSYAGFGKREINVK